MYRQWPELIFLGQSLRSLRWVFPDCGVRVVVHVVGPSILGLTQLPARGEVLVLKWGGVITCDMYMYKIPEARVIKWGRL